MSDHRDLLDAYAREEYGTFHEFVDRGEQAPKAFAALRAVLDVCDNWSVADARGTDLVSVHDIEEAIASALSDG